MTRSELCCCLMTCGREPLWALYTEIDGEPYPDDTHACSKHVLDLVQAPGPTTVHGIDRDGQIHEEPFCEIKVVMP